MKLQSLGGIVLLLSLPISSSAQPNILAKSNLEAVARLEKERTKQEAYAKDYFEKFLKCDGFDLYYGSPERFYYDKDGKCNQIQIGEQ